MHSVICGLLLETLSRGRWSLYLSISVSVGHDREPCKKAEPIEVPFRVHGLLGPKEQGRKTRLGFDK